jgi:hypothetical protein
MAEIIMPAAAHSRVLRHPAAPRTAFSRPPSCRYERKAAGALPAAAHDRVPDAYMHVARLSDDVIALRGELEAARAAAAQAGATWDTFRKERDVHRMHHKRVTQARARACSSPGVPYSITHRACCTM